MAARQRDQPLRSCEILQRDGVGTAARSQIEPGDELHQRAVASIAGGEQKERRGAAGRSLGSAADLEVRLGLEAYRQLATDDRLDSRRRRFLGEFQRPKQV